MLVKICGMTRQRELDAAARAGANFCGFIFHPQSPRYVKPEKADALNSWRMLRIGVFTQADAEEILRIMRVARLDMAQLHASQHPDIARKIGTHRVIRVLWPQKYESCAALREDMNKYAGTCAWFLLDAGSVGGGSGKKLDWSRLAAIKPAHPWFLAGGLTPENVASAVVACHPTGLDLNSGLEDAPGQKSETLINKAMQNINALKNRSFPENTEEQ